MNQQQACCSFTYVAFPSLSEQPDAAIDCQARQDTRFFENHSTSGSKQQQTEQLDKLSLQAADELLRLDFGEVSGKTKFIEIARAPTL